MKFFKERMVCIVTFSISLSFILIGCIITILGSDDSVYSIGMPMIAFFIPPSILLFLMLFLSKNIFNIWLYFGPLCFLFAGITTIQSDIHGCSWGICYGRDMIALQVSVIASISTFIISIIIAIIWHFLEKRKKRG